MQAIEKPVKNYLSLGLTLIVLSTLTFGLALIAGVKEDSFFGIFLINYIIATSFFLTIWIGGTLKRENSLPILFLALVLFLISAYSLNQLIPIFETSTTWMCVLLVISAVAFISINFWEKNSIAITTLDSFCNWRQSGLIHLPHNLSCTSIPIWFFRWHHTRLFPACLRATAFRYIYT